MDRLRSGPSMGMWLDVWRTVLCLWLAAVFLYPSAKPGSKPQHAEPCTLHSQRFWSTKSTFQAPSFQDVVYFVACPHASSLSDESWGGASACMMACSSCAACISSMPACIPKGIHQNLNREL
eukprot:scaffold192485_cov18-Tisochrysis_lutea.AAC.2